MSSVSLPSHQVRAERVVKAQLFKVVVDGSLTNIGSGIFSAIAIAIVFPLIDGKGSAASCWIWCALMLVVMLHGIWLGRQAGRAGQDVDRLLRYQRTLVIQGGFIAAAWGSSAWIILPSASPTAEVFLVTAMAMVVMGGAGNQAPHWEMLVTCTVSLATVFAAGLARFGDRPHIAMAIVFAMYALVALWVAAKQGIGMRQQILVSLENESLRAAAEAERERANEASEAKTAFLAAASHDLRQPLHALVQYSAHLHRANRDPELDDIVRRIGGSLDAMRGLLDSILDLSKLMIGGVQPVVTAFPLASLLERLDVQLRPLAAAKNLQFGFERSPAHVLSDDVLLERILRNLILNSIRYTNAGQVILRCRQRRDILQIQVWDTGIGIPRGDLRRIFDPFYQVGNRARDRHKGLGLGLAIVRQLCDLLGHRVKVKTKVGKGTVFAVSVPLCAAPIPILPSQAVSDRAVSDYVRGAFVLLVDDDPLSREATEHTLRAFGCRAIAAASGREVMEKLQHQEFAPQILIADYRLETETGIEVIHAVTGHLRRLFGETFSIPALIVSGDTAPEELRRVHEHGYLMLHKPVATEDLWSALNRLLERKALQMEF